PARSTETAPEGETVATDHLEGGRKPPGGPTGPPQDGKRAVKNAVCSVSPKLRSLLLAGKLEITWRVCSVRDYSDVLHCFKCLKVEHRAKECKGELTCKKCAGNHDRKDCKAAEAKCAVCQRTKIPSLDIKHEAYSQTHPRKGLFDGAAYKCAQINLGRGRRATECLVERIVREKISVVIVQEPYVINNGICGMRSGFKVHYMKSADNSKPVRAAVVVAGAGLRGMTLADKSDANLVSVEVSNGSGLKLIVVSGYLPPEERYAGEFRENLTKLRNVIGELNGTGSAVVIGSDANSKSILWNSPTEDWRRRELETVLEDNSLVVLNNNEEPTFVGHRGSSFIDFTAVNFRAYGMINSWHLSDDGTLSGHGLIGFEFGDDADNAHWHKQRRKVAGLLEEIGSSAGSRKIETVAEKVNDAVIAACEESRPRRREFRRSVPWWTPQLTRLRHEANRLRRRYQRCNAEDIRREREREYRAKYAECKNAIRTTRTEKWREFCIRSGGKDPWGLAYRIVRRKRGNAGANVTLKRGDNGYTQNAQETAELLLETFFPEDDADEDEEVHAAVRARANDPIGNEQDDTPFTRYEVDAAFKSMNAKNAPGLDGITAGIAGRAYDAEPEVLEEAASEGHSEGGRFTRERREKLSPDKFAAAIRLSEGTVYGYRDRAGGAVHPEREKQCGVQCGDLAGHQRRVRPRAVVTNQEPAEQEGLPAHPCSDGERLLLRARSRDRGTAVLSVSRRGCEIVAFADDTTLLVRGQQYKTLKGRANSALVTILDWSRANKLEFNAGKSEALFFGKTHGQQRPTFKLGAETIYCKENVKYLGVVIDEKLNFKAHVQYATGKARELTNKIGAAAKVRWGLSGRAAATIYEGAIEPAMPYAPPVWAGALRLRETRRLIGAQRVLAVRAARAYATTSAEAAAAIAALLSADTRARELARRRGIKNGEEGITMVIAGREIHSRGVEVGRRLLCVVHPSEAGAVSFSKDTDGEYARSAGVVICTDGSRGEDGSGGSWIECVTITRRS
ncbi:hypothetical protein Trydic_g15232, partial [Trypoxylus dichotomus]